MDAYRLNVKLYFDPAVDLDQERLIPVFHRWIQNHELDELLIDVADYKHVPQGPGVMLIAHDANYAVDSTDGRPGLLYARKRPTPGDFTERLRDAFLQTLRAASALERDVPGVRFAPGSWAFRVNDRLLAPNTPETLRDVEPELRDVLAELFDGGHYAWRWEGDPRAPFGIEVAATATPELSVLLRRLESAALPIAAVA